MSFLLKDIFSPEFYDNLTKELNPLIKGFDKKLFINEIFDEEWKSRELKARIRHTSIVLQNFLPYDFESASIILVDFIKSLRQKGIRENTLEYMFLPDYIEVFGLNHLEASINAIEEITQFTSCEFAVRPFILKYGNKMLEQMTLWSRHQNQNVRRLSSEGARSRLPWAMALPELKKDPSPILQILENLKCDESLFVRKSVANNLNDISKDNPQITLDLAKKWKGENASTDWIIRHACRTLLKNGNTEALNLFGMDSNISVDVKELKVLTPKVSMQDYLQFTFEVQNSSLNNQMVRIEYGIYYFKANNRHSRKVFKVSEREFKAGEIAAISKKQSFKPITTRKHYPGPHYVSIIINGKELQKAAFIVVTE